MGKIPKSYKGKPVTAISNYAIWCDSILTASAIACQLSMKDNKTGIPCMGKIQYKGKKYFWCRYGFLNDDAIYTKN